MNNITDPVTRMNLEAMSEAEAAEQCYGCHSATGKGDCPIHQPKNAEHIRLNHNSPGDYIWCFRRWNKWHVEFGMQNNTRIKTYILDNIDALLKQHPWDIKQVERCEGCDDEFSDAWAGTKHDPKYLVRGGGCGCKAMCATCVNKYKHDSNCPGYVAGLDLPCSDHKVPRGTPCNTLGNLCWNRYEPLTGITK